jgi:phosphate-selective porin OprO/OprP
VAALAGLASGFARFAGAQASESSMARTLDARLGAIERQLKALEGRLAALEGNISAAPDLTLSHYGSNGNFQTVTLAAQIEALTEKISRIETQGAQGAATAAPQAASASVVSAGRDGFAIRSADGAFGFYLRGILQADTRLFPNGAPAAGASTLTITKVRPTFEGTLFKSFAFKIMPDFGSGTTSLQDAYIDATIRPWLKFRAGKFKGPVGLERLVSDPEVEFYERFLPTNLVPNREVGAQLFGEPWGGVVSYAGGIFNGVADGSSTDIDTDNHREFEGRVFFHPFRRTALRSLQGFGAGLAGTSGSKTGTVSAPIVAAYRTSAQQTFFRYRSDGTAAGTVVADGAHRRISPQAYYYRGPLGVWGEYVLSSQDVARGATGATINNAAWQVALTYVLTGENASTRSVTPARSLDLRQRTWGAFEIGTRYGRLTVDKSAFPFYADPLTAASAARAWTVGLNWYANKNVKVVLNYEQTDFQTVEGGVKRKQERAILERFQLAF